VTKSDKFVSGIKAQQQKKSLEPVQTTPKAKIPPVVANKKEKLVITTKQTQQTGGKGTKPPEKSPPQPAPTIKPPERQGNMYPWNNVHIGSAEKRDRVLSAFRHFVLRRKNLKLNKRILATKLYNMYSLFSARKKVHAFQRMNHQAELLDEKVRIKRTLINRIAIRKKIFRLSNTPDLPAHDKSLYHTTTKKVGRYRRVLANAQKRLKPLLAYKFKKYVNSTQERKYYLWLKRKEKRPRRHIKRKPKIVVMHSFLYKAYKRFIIRKRKLQRALLLVIARNRRFRRRRRIRRIFLAYTRMKHILWRTYTKTTFGTSMKRRRLKRLKNNKPRPPRGKTVYYAPRKKKFKVFLLKVRQSKNNVFATLTNNKSKPFGTYSAGRTAMSGPRRSTPFAAELLGRMIGSKLNIYFQEYRGYIILKTPLTKHIRSFLQSLTLNFSRFSAILDLIPHPHGHGLRGRKVRRL
jgi:ribosomal protein S11